MLSLILLLTHRLIKWFFCCNDIDKFEDLWLMSELVDCFGSSGNFHGILLSLLYALLAFLR